MSTLPPAVSVDIAFEAREPPPEVVNQINRMLSEPWTRSERDSGRVYFCKGLRPAEIEYLVFYYLGAGWTAEHLEDQREGSSIRFRARNPRSAK